MKPQLVGRHWQVGLLDTSVPGESTVVSANSPRPRRLAAAPGPAPAPTQSAGAFAPPTTPILFGAAWGLVVIFLPRPGRCCPATGGLAGRQCLRTQEVTL